MENNTFDNKASNSDISNNNDINSISGERRESHVFKFVILGDSNVGKTSILYHYIFGKFKKIPQHTIGVEFSSKTLIMKDKEIKLQLWDTAGQEKFRSVTKSYYKGAVGVLLVYDITNWLTDAKNAAKANCTIAVVGNKSDLKDQRVIKYNDGAKFCQDNDLIHMECSALTGENIETVFNLMAKSILNKVEEGAILLAENPLLTRIVIKSDPLVDDKREQYCAKC